MCDHVVGCSVGPATHYFPRPQFLVPRSWRSFRPVHNPPHDLPPSIPPHHPPLLCIPSHLHHRLSDLVNSFLFSLIYRFFLTNFSLYLYLSLSSLDFSADTFVREVFFLPSALRYLADRLVSEVNLINHHISNILQLPPTHPLPNPKKKKSETLHQKP